jgi:hypothetical protein
MISYHDGTKEHCISHHSSELPWCPRDLLVNKLVPPQDYQGTRRTKKSDQCETSVTSLS